MLAMKDTGINILEGRNWVMAHDWLGFAPYDWNELQRRIAPSIVYLHNSLNFGDVNFQLRDNPQSLYLCCPHCSVVKTVKASLPYKL